MGNRAIYTIIEKGKEEHFYSHWGATPMSPMLRLQQALEIQEEIKEPIRHIFSHLSREGVYENPRLIESDMFCDAIAYEPNQPRAGSDVEMYITLNLDEQTYVLDFNEKYPAYISMGKYEIPIEAGLKSLQKVLDYAEKENISGFYEVAKIYNDQTGMTQAMEESRANGGVQKILDSPESEASRQRLRQMTGENSKKMEENTEEDSQEV